jgi:hypothetical protein
MPKTVWFVSVTLGLLSCGGSVVVMPILDGGRISPDGGSTTVRDAGETPTEMDAGILMPDADVDAGKLDSGITMPDAGSASSDAGVVTSSLSGFFVNQSAGSDSNAGTFASPFQTLEKARDTLRPMLPSMSTDLAVNIIGDYQLKTEFTLGANDSGKNGFNVVYRSSKELAGRLHGARFYAPTWTSAGNGLYKTTLLDLGETPRVVYLNDVAQIRATSEGDGFNLSAAGNVVTQTAGPAISGFANQGDIEFVGTNKNYWKQPIQKLASVNGAQYTLKDPGNIGGNGDGQFKGNDTLFVTNALELVTKESEWYFSKATKELFIKKSANPQGSKLAIPQQEIFVTINGAAHIEFRDLTFQYAGYNVLPNAIGIQTMGQGGVINSNLVSGYSEGTMKGAIQMNNAAAVTFKNNTFTELGSFALNCNLNCLNHEILGNVFLNMGAGAIIYGNTSGQGASIKGNHISNNAIRGTGRHFWGAAAIYFIYAQDLLIEHNDISDTSYSTESKNNRVSYNHIWNFMTKVYDGAAVYTLSNQPGSSIDNNYIHDAIHDYGGLYPDQGSGNISIERNVVDVGKTFWLYIWSDVEMVNLNVHDNFVKSYGCQTNFGTYSTRSDLCEIKRGKNTTYVNNLAVTGAWPSAASAIIAAAGRLP